MTDVKSAQKWWFAQLAALIHRKAYQILSMPMRLPVALDLPMESWVHLGFIYNYSELHRCIKHSPRCRQRHTPKNVGHNKASTHEAACYQGVAPIQAQGMRKGLTQIWQQVVAWLTFCSHLGFFRNVFSQNRSFGTFWWGPASYSFHFWCTCLIQIKW